MQRIPEPVARAIRQLREDLVTDPLLGYVLLLTVAVSGLGIWFRVPNFGAPDEYSRLLHPMKPVGYALSESSIEGFQRGVADGRALGATFYLYALVLLPVFLAVLLAGRVGQFQQLGTLTSRWDLWHAAPAWFWTTAVLLGRLASVAFAVGSVYVTYRLGADLRDRWTGRVAAVGLALSVVFLGEAHLLGEDVPMLFFLLVTVHLAARYVDTGRRRYFWIGSLSGAIAIALKLSGGVAALLLGVAYLLRTRAQGVEDGPLVRPKLLAGGLVIGAVTVYVGMPSLLFGGPDELLVRIQDGFTTKTTKAGGRAAPIWYWFLRQYLRGLGWPLFLAIGAGLVGTAYSIARRRGAESRTILLLVGVAAYLLVYSRWEFVRVRHLLPTVPLLALIASDQARRLHRSRRSVTRVLLALVLLSTAVYAGVGAVQYTADPRDRATDWMRTNVHPEETVEVYENSVADVAVVHGRPVAHYPFQENGSDAVVDDEADYTEWMVSMPERNPDYVQLTGAELAYLNPYRPDGDRFPRRRAYVRGLLEGRYNYTVVAEFGQRPRYRSAWPALVRAGLDPDPAGTERYVVILERTDG